MNDCPKVPDTDFRLLFEKSPAPYLILLPDDRFTIVDVNDAYLRATSTGRERLIGQGLFEAFPDNPADPAATGTHNLRASLERAIATKAPDTMAFQRYDIRCPQGGFEERYWSPLNIPLLAPDGGVLYLIHRVEDVTEFVRIAQASERERNRVEALQTKNDEMTAELLSRNQELQRANAQLRRAEERQRFLLKLSDALRPLSDPEVIKAAAARVLGEQLAASRVFYAEVDGDDWVVGGSYGQGGVPIAPGRYAAATYGHSVMNTYRAGQRIVFRDTRSESSLSPAERKAYAAIDVIGAVGVPLVKEGTLVATLGVHSDTPRDWTEGEIVLVEETAERTWAAVEQARAEEALRASEARLSRAFEIETVGVLFFDKDARFLDANDTFLRMIGYERAALARGELSSERVTVPEGMSRTWQAFEELYATGRFTPYEKELVRPDGSRWWGLFAGTRLSDSENVEFVLDITERKQAEQKLRESDRRKDEFLAMLAHELRNPLGAITNTVKLLERRVHEADLRQCLNILNRQTGMLRGMVDELLDVSRITRGLVELKQERVDLARVADRALESVQPLMDEKRHEVSVMLPRKGLAVEGDPVRLEQVLVNLLINAAKYTDPGGRIELCVERRGEHAELRVRDTGIGMTPEVLDRIFDLFGQAERGLARSEGGLGIGLTIVRQLVELHGGRIGARSSGLGQGAEFIVLLPLAGVDEPALATAAAVEPTAVGRSKRVLVVDDSRDIADTLALLLEDSGHEVAVAYEGPGALAKAEEFGPQVILIDIGLPGMDGYQVAKHLRQHRHTQNAVLAALTGYGQAEDVERARRAGFDQHFTKPVDVDALEAFVNDLDPNGA